eukprot:6212780-Pyramimonas_sp.AAC.1
MPTATDGPGRPLEETEPLPEPPTGGSTNSGWTLCTGCRTKHSVFSLRSGRSCTCRSMCASR